MLSIRDPIHGFIRADRLESALVNSRPLQRLRFVRQLGVNFLVFPGAEHSRFSHTLGVMHLAGRVYDALSEASEGLLPRDPDCRERRLVRVAALLHDIGHAPFSHSTEELFEGGIDHEEMTRKLMAAEEIQQIFELYGDGIEPADVASLLEGNGGPAEKLLYQILSSELDVDKMDYLLRDSLYCGVRYGTYDLDRLVDTMLPLESRDGGLEIGIEEGGVHALEALVMARYYMFTQVYFNVTGKVFELHLNTWLEEQGYRWPADPEAFLEEDDLTVHTTLRRSDSPHAAALVQRRHFPLAFESREHLTKEEKETFESILPELEEHFGPRHLLVSHAAKDPHRLGSKSRILVRHRDGSLEPVEEVSQFMRHLTRIDRYRIYAPEAICAQVAARVHEHWRP